MPKTALAQSVASEFPRGIAVLRDPLLNKGTASQMYEPHYSNLA